ncbi:alpha/beta hydrolase [Agromyces sp. Marseille-P2726]|uniref:alpha/beta hydrolase n=1 Tax=Agromyces sp. Marseille-P2726 TaxID=2709132 RepID=UPI00156E9E19|nr:alpha/beta hydrolase [Agromyces sp. Marseille-P2726]
MPRSTRPSFDPELAPALDGLPRFFTTLEPSAIGEFRAATARERSSIEDVVAGRPVEVVDHTVPGYDGGEITVSVVRRTDDAGSSAPRAGSALDGGSTPGIYLLHGGGMVGGSRWAVVPMLVGWVLEHGAVAASVDYRLAPEFPDPVPVEDALAGYEWFVARAGELAFDPQRVLVGGVSAGGGLAAGTILLARDRGIAMPAAQLLMSPMLDDRNDSDSSRELDGVGVWDRTSNETGWTALLGDRRGTDDVTIAAAPARAADLAGVPPTYIDVGSAEVFRDEVVAFATRIWAAGGSAELHVWPGGFHGFQGIVPSAAVSQAAVQARDAWVRRVLSA